MNKLLGRFLTLALTIPLAAFSVVSHAQELSSVKGGLGGLITDKSGAVVPGTKVTAKGDADTRTVESDPNGRFTISSLTPGLYQVTVEKEGFNRAEAKDVEIVINRIITLNFELQPGAVAETIEVNGTAAEIDTTSTALGDNLTDTFYSQVPTARNVGSLFYVAPGAVSGGGTGNSNPSIGGATGLENSYTADGVGINDSGYGGLGVYSPSYGSLGTGINLSFIQEVQVKTGAFEPKYGRANGGVVQIVTKSGGTQYHGALAAYFAPEWMGAGYRFADNYRLFAPPSFLRGSIFARPAYDASLEFGGYIPIKGHNDRLFFFGAFNPSVDNVRYIAAPTSFASPVAAHGPYTTSITAYSWAGKLTYKLTDSTSIEGSAFGDPSRSNYAFGAAYADPFSYPNINLRTTTGFSRWSFGGQNVVLRMTSSINPTTVLNFAATYKKSNFTESGFTNDHAISDRTTGIENFQGVGLIQNPINHDYGVSFDLQKTVRLVGSHTFSVGWGFDHAIYNAFRDYTGTRFNFPTTNAAGDSSVIPSLLAGASTSAAFRLYKAPAACQLQYCPNYIPPDSTTGEPEQVILRQIRGLFSSPDVSSSQSYNALYGNDNWTINRHVTINAGLRWEQEQLNGPNQSYVFNDNWSPRLGINVDPFGDGKTKVFFNWGRYTQALPTDAAIRELNQELDVTPNTPRWAPPQDGNGNILINTNGTITPILDAAHLLNGVPGSGVTASIGASPSTLEQIHTGTKLNFEEEYVAGIERQIKGFAVSARYSDRRLLRIVEDMQGVSPEAASGQSGAVLNNEVYVIGNPSPASDYFINEDELVYSTSDPNAVGPASCTADYGAQFDTLGNYLGSACAQNPDPQNPVTGPGAPFPDGKPDGFSTPIRHYQAFEIEANKNFSHNFLLRANYRFAKLYGNYEGLFRNDNQQSDPGISSLFDFTPGKLGLLGAQFSPGYLNTDRRNVGNLFGAYTFPTGYVKNLTLGLGLRGQSGNPLNYLGSHPVYGNTGEIPLGGRGIGGALNTTISLDMHTDYSLGLGEKFHLKLAFDAFNVANSKAILYDNQNIDTGFQAAPDLTGPNFANKTRGTPTTFQRPFYGRGSVRIEF
jgi:hypothetical protein